MIEIKNKQILWIIGYMSVLLIVCIVGVVATAWYFRFTPELPFGIAHVLKPIFPSSTPTPADEKTLNNTNELFVPSLRKFTLEKTGNTLFIIRGTFTDKPSFKQKLLEGTFIIDGDPNKTPITVFMTTRTGALSVGRFTKSLDGKSTWKSEATPVLESLLKPNKPVELRVTTTSSFGKEMASVFTAVLTNGWKFPKNFAIIPQMVGVVVE